MRRRILLLTLLAACRRPDPPPQPPDLVTLIRKLEDPDPNVRHAAAVDLAKRGPAASGAVSALVRALKEDDPVDRYWAANALGHLGPEASEAVTELAEALRTDPDPRVRAAGAKALARVRGSSEGGLPALEAALKDPEITVRRAALDSLRQIDPEVQLEASKILKGAGSPNADEIEAVRTAVEAQNHPPPVEIGRHFHVYAGTPSKTALGSWPTYRGPGFDGISREPVPLSERWPAEGPRVLWTADLGPAWAGAVIHGGCVFVLDYDSKTDSEGLRCLSLDDGQEIWRRWHTVKLIQQHGFLHSTPAASDQSVVAIGAKGHVLCVDPATGRLRWSLDLVREFGFTMDSQFHAQTPLIDGATVVFAIGGPDALLIGVDAASGKLRWKTPNPKKYMQSYTSVLPVTWNGRKTYVYPAERQHVVAVSAEEADAGTVLWETAWSEKQMVCPSPVPLEDGLLFLTAGYGAGNALIRVSETDREVQVKTLWKQEVREGLSSEAHTPIYQDGLLFAVLPGDARPRQEEFACMDPHQGGKILWTSGKDRRFGMWQPYLLADGKFFILDKSGMLTMIRAQGKSYEELGRAKICTGPDPIPPMALASGRLVLRDNRRLYCVDLRK